MPEKTWYAVYTKPRNESVAEQNLWRQGIDTYLPLVATRRRRRGKWLHTVEPLFPRYLFVRMDFKTQSSVTIRSTRGAVGLVRFGAEPVSVPTALVDELKRSEGPENGLHVYAESRLTEGDRVVILDGPFKDVVGVFQTVDGERRAMILLDFLGRQNSAAFDMDNLMKVGAVS
jgi:transcriptional antiterminator RfaH